jgi:succinyl-CoA synthetase alpha subunit
LSVLVNENSQVVIQGLTSNVARKHALNMLQNNTKIVAGVSPTRGGSYIEKWPVYDSVQQALDNHEINVSLIYAPPQYAGKAIIESIEAEISLIVCVTEGIPIQDMLRVHNRLLGSKSVLIGPCSPGITVPGKTKIGFIPDIVCSPGNIGVVGKSGTLTYEICYQLTKAGYGQSTIIGIGGDPIKGISFKEALKLFEADEATDLIVMVGEIGGRDEEEASEFIKHYVSKPVIAYIAGRTAPEDIPMGHAGAMVTNNQGGYPGKVHDLMSSGVQIATSITEVATLSKKILN